MARRVLVRGRWSGVAVHHRGVRVAGEVAQPQRVPELPPEARQGEGDEENGDHTPHRNLAFREATHLEAIMAGGIAPASMVSSGTFRRVS
jgi:hypothetical protein